MKKISLNITIFGEKEIPKLELIQTYINDRKFGERKQKKDGLSFVKTFRDSNSMKLNIYEYSDIPDKKAKDIANHQCVIIMFDMTERKSFEDVLDKWIKFLREIKYTNTIILFGTTNNKSALPMTDKEEIEYLIEVTEIKGEFYDIGNKTEKEKCDLIDSLIESSYEDAKNNLNKKDCIIY